MDLETWLPQEPAAGESLALTRVSAESQELVLKRLMDVVGSLVLLVVLSPVFLLTAILVRLSSPGPIVIWQERLGLNQEPFRMLKLRTMVADAPRYETRLQQQMVGTFFKVKNDPRITPVGRFLRRYSLDELPQLVNVLRGDMSLVGPRPLFAWELERFREWTHLRRFSMKPGLTCIWQVSGRSNTTDEDRMRYDVEYVERWSLWLDVRLLLRTVPAVLRAEGAA
jgi:lipopolysaccharide/colanic/teichoic acid biosynthesis glycosyltransferase